MEEEGDPKEEEEMFPQAPRALHELQTGNALAGEVEAALATVAHDEVLVAPGNGGAGLRTGSSRSEAIIWRAAGAPCGGLGFQRSVRTTLVTKSGTISTNNEEDRRRGSARLLLEREHRRRGGD
ncbi:hypothetical protein LR48_Vigan08g070900 [Vigna angularis]|uniref:Uncharacterized protein n=1 Tax=Phaseolus angularis TaxID=3914 RepID=A0A0L9V4J8_PHAAN|nr:hypothetical protein LR48_Vigan08g070900 [Vigna angularis]